MDEKGCIDTDKLNIISYDSANHRYLKIGEKVGTAYSDGKLIK